MAEESVGWPWYKNQIIQLGYDLRVKGKRVAQKLPCTYDVILLQNSNIIYETELNGSLNFKLANVKLFTEVRKIYKQLKITHDDKNTNRNMENQ